MCYTESMSKKLPRSVNLIETIAPPGDAFTIFYEWAFKVGKFLLIGVQVIVIIVFVMRLSVDRIRNDLTSDINNQVELLMMPDFRKNEAKFRDLQTLFEDFSKLDETHQRNARQIVSVLDSIPENIELENFSFNNGAISSSFSVMAQDDQRESSALEVVKKYETFLKQDPTYADVNLNLEQKGDGGSEIEFRVSYIIRDKNE